MMNQSPCSGLGNPNEMNFCAPLKQLYSEHPALTEKMVEFNKLAHEYEAEETTNWQEAVEELHHKLEVFVADLDPHSEREEDVLFEMMAKHIGREGGPIAVMEHEHSVAKQNIKEFFEKAAAIKANKEEMTREKALQLFHHLKVVYTTLTDHFNKEEQILFPMAQKMLSDEEKEELAAQFKNYK